MQKLTLKIHINLRSKPLGILLFNKSLVVFVLLKNVKKAEVNGMNGYRIEKIKHKQKGDDWLKEPKNKSLIKSKRQKRKDKKRG